MIKFYDRDRCFYRFLEKKALEKWIDLHSEVAHLKGMLLLLYDVNAYYCFWNAMIDGKQMVQGTATREMWIKKNLNEILIGLRQRSE